MSLLVTRSRAALFLASVAGLIWWLFFKKFPCPYCDGRGWNWDPHRGMWYVKSCERCQPEEKRWATNIPLGKEENRIVGDKEVQT